MNKNLTNYSKSLSRGVVSNRIHVVSAMSPSSAEMSCGGIGAIDCCDSGTGQAYQKLTTWDLEIC